jgi:hypothetical protein
MVRERVAAGAAIDELVPAAVAEYIARHRLYRSPSEVRRPVPASTTGARG